VLSRVDHFQIPTVVVDDGSSATSYTQVQALVRNHTGTTLLRHELNQGKGESVQSALRYAANAGYTHAIQLDADGQHCIEDLPRMIDLMRVSPTAIVCGLPQFDHSIPAVRFYAKKMTDWWVNLQTLSRDIADSMCGYRGYPLEKTVNILNRYSANSIGRGMDFDVGMIVHACWEGVPVRYFRTRVIYPDDGVSHFHYVRDNIAMTRMHFSLAIAMPGRIPALISRRRSAFR